jgi:hypothetical protein
MGIAMIAGNTSNHHINRSYGLIADHIKTDKNSANSTRKKLGDVFVEVFNKVALHLNN